LKKHNLKKLDHSPSAATTAHRARSSRRQNRMIESTTREAKTSLNVLLFQIWHLGEHLLAR